MKVNKADTPKKQATKKQAPKKARRSLSSVVGQETYTVWVNMLRELVPDGRTQRLSVVVASMLQYAQNIALSKPKKDSAEDSVAQALLAATEVGDPSEVADLLQDVTAQLCKDAGVEYQRTSSRGSHYSLLADAYEEFMRWYDMPWERAKRTAQNCWIFWTNMPPPCRAQPCARLLNSSIKSNEIVIGV